MSIAQRTSAVEKNKYENQHRTEIANEKRGENDAAELTEASDQVGGADTTLVGLVLEGSRGQYRVQTPEGSLLCVLRGKLRKKLIYARSGELKGTTLRNKVRRANVAAKDPVVVGDRVRVVPMGGGRGTIGEILPRERGAFTRDDADAGTVTSVAGIEQLIAVFAVRDPEPHLRLLDRMLVLAEAQSLAAVVCLNKVDLGATPELLKELETYRAIGYPVVLVSAITGEGLDELRRLLAGRTSALLGPSGVGKSSLLNAVEPELGLRVSDVSQSTHKGRHTTTGTRVVPLEGAGGGFVADTAGIRTMGLGSAAAGRLDWCFRELRPYLGECQLGDCTHVHEPGCAVRAAVERGEVTAARYESYCRLAEQGAGEMGRNWRDAVESKSVVGEGDFRM